MPEKVIRTYDELRTALAFDAEDEYRRFCMQGIPCERPFIGVRIPIIRRIVDTVAPESYVDILAVQPVAIEEVIARGVLIDKLPYAEMLKYFDSQIDYIDNWCTCDIFCSALKVVKKHKAEVFENKIEKLLDDKREFAVRVGVVLLKAYYVEFDYLNVIFDRVEKLCGREEYYIRMGLAWLVAECFIKFPDETLAYLEVSKLPKWTFNKTISKICDSYRVDAEMKELLRKMRK